VIIKNIPDFGEYPFHCFFRFPLSRKFAGNGGSSRKGYSQNKQLHKQANKMWRNYCLGLTVMNRSDLIARMAKTHPQLQIKDAELGAKVIIDALSNTLLKGGRVEVRGFGSFSLNYRSTHQGRNPRTGGKVQVPAKYVPRFKAGKELRERVDSD